MMTKIGDKPFVPTPPPLKPTELKPTDGSQTQANANDVTIFTIATNNQGSGGGNQSSGGNQEKLAITLATSLLGDKGTPTSIGILAVKLAGLSKALENAGIKSANISLVDGKLEITELFKPKDNETKDTFNTYTTLYFFMGNQLSSAQSDVSAQLILSILSMASEARSEVIKMIIDAMEKNHQQWLEVLKQMAEKSFENKQEAKALLEKLMSKIASKDFEAANAIVAALMSMSGIPSGAISLESIDRLNKQLYDDFVARNDQSSLAKFAAKEKLDLKKPQINDEEFKLFISAVNEKDFSKAKKIIDASVTSGEDGSVTSFIKDVFQDISLRRQLGI